ncbi:MFS transporter, DHA1 family, tetracycline resistance protein [Pseudorhodobacter antarcticus]|uniref:MFS transporter, DHA1 family, tetracycline resistance protein n=2 Tax=Pseudorhodobacter antarcticus TaxID=1077947 RepID=A0A1H8CKY2_9RHOB|nr:MFS transporter, DHA1 family, tetracycline resistance protein [Pseudorhodobacter antarcticus]
MTVALDAIGIGLIFPVMPDLIGSVTGGSLATAALWGGVLATSYAVMQFIFGPVIGSLSDSYGRRPVLLLSLVVMVFAYLAMALAPTIWLLLAARLLAGIAGATQATATAFIADISEPSERGRRFGLIGACFGVGFILGPMIGGLVAGIDTRAPFYVAGALALLNLILGVIILPETVTNENRRPFTLSRANPLGALHALTKTPGLKRPLVTFLIIAIAMNVYPAIWAFYGKARFGWDAAMIGYSLGVYGISFAIGQAFLVGPLIKRYGEHRAALGGLFVNLATLTALGLVTSGPLAIMLTPITALGGVVTPALQALLSRQTPDNAQGELQGVLASVNAAAMITAPLLMTATFAYFTAPDAPIFSPGAPFLLAAALMVAAIALHSQKPLEKPINAP